MSYSRANYSDWKRIEDKLSAQAQNTSRFGYAFYVILSEEDYQTLKRLYKVSPAEPTIYPWCHLKLLTETYVRIYTSKHAQNFLGPIAEKIELPQKNGRSPKQPKCWNSVLEFIQKLELESAGDTGKKFYKNIVFHAGVPIAYFEKIFQEANTLYKDFRNVELALENINSEFLKKTENHFSSFFKDAFHDNLAQKELFRWFLNLITLSEKYELSEDDFQSIIPPHLFEAKSFQTQILSKKVENRSSSAALQKQTNNQGLYFDLENYALKYLVKMPSSINPDIATLAEKHLHWAQQIDELKSQKTNVLNLFVKPLDLSNWPTLEMFMRSAIPLNSNCECFIFDDAGWLIKPSNIAAFSSEWHIISKQNIPTLEDLGCRQEDLLHDAWDFAQWNYYFLSAKGHPELPIPLPNPYGKMDLKTKSKTYYLKGDWISPDFLGLSHGLKVFGGKTPPEFQPIDLKESSHPTWPFFHAPDSGKLRFRATRKQTQESWQIDIPQNQVSDSVYGIQYVQIGSDFRELKSDLCLWYPNLQVRYQPDGLRLPQQELKLTVNYPSKWTFKGSENVDISSQSHEQELTWRFTHKHKDCYPILMFQDAKKWIEVPLRLPYLSIWLHSKGSNIDEWQEDKPISLKKVKVIYQQDSQARIKFYYHGRRPVEFNILIGQKKIFRQIELDDDNKFIHSIALGEIHNFEHLQIEIQNEFYDLVLDQIPEKQLETDKEPLDPRFAWNFERIFEEMKRKMNDRSINHSNI